MAAFEVPMSRWGKGWEVGARKAISQHEKAQRTAASILAEEHGIKHRPGERSDLCEKCAKANAPERT